ncbi:hypothetical protein SAMN06265365_102257 [Tistlia consotensis]|uniref:Uncharacterized protein n=1 Tax=Tistlia consotensis USBA 355 TaxID=560819 RepID=A0A1Y6BEN2_9PROT|nr:hypothetical protein [Tistlia consotensis]SMF07390.1 hypothetical protein SAMN05428998_10459 [Tistlia consotensis USBA 355]SNR35915.1 hypothetical protein SAMN06265365_102257 [Tistlia consotensis]
MIRLSILLVAIGVAALVVAQIESRPPPPRFQVADLVGSWTMGGADKCGSGEAPTLEVAADGRAKVTTEAYKAAGRLLGTEGMWRSPFRDRTFTQVPLLDEQGTRWVFIFGSDSDLRVLEGVFDYWQASDGRFMVLPRLPPLYRCS